MKTVSIIHRPPNGVISSGAVFQIGHLTLDTTGILVSLFSL